MDRNLILVGLGGLIGSILRYLASLAVASYATTLFPFATLAVNVIGCFLIGLTLAIGERWAFLTPEWRIFLTTGLCGGFTTFSTFSYESIGLLLDGQLLLVSVNVVGSVFLGFAATYLAIAIVRGL